MRYTDTPKFKIREKVLVEIAKAAFDPAGDYKQDLERIPFIISPTEEANYRESVWRERAIASERVRLGMGLSLRPAGKPVHLTEGFDESNIDEKYYEPPLMQVIPSACDACPDNEHEVTDICRGCIARPCLHVCPKGAISKGPDGKSVIDKEKCINCGKCKQVCPYGAIVKKERPCAKACGIKAIHSDEYGRAQINNEECVSCGQCMLACPFGAISDKSQIFQMIKAIREGAEMIAEVAPSFEGQFGKDITAKQVISALMEVGFKDVYEVALGADVGAVSEAEHYAKHVATGDLPFLLTSCCPAWSVLAKRVLGPQAAEVSRELTPMVATARAIKKKHPNSRIVFIGPCAAKKLEASRRTIRSDVDFVITFEELSAIFKAKEIDFDKYEKGRGIHNATGAGRGYATAGGVSKAIGECIKEYYPDVEYHVEHAEGLDNCKKTLLMAKAGKMQGCMIEGMGCPGGCVAGVGTILETDQARKAIDKVVSESTKEIPPVDLKKIIE